MKSHHRLPKALTSAVQVYLKEVCVHILQAQHAGGQRLQLRQQLRVPPLRLPILLLPVRVRAVRQRALCQRAEEPHQHRLIAIGSPADDLLCKGSGAQSSCMSSPSMHPVARQQGLPASMWYVAMVNRSSLFALRAICLPSMLGAPLPGFPEPPLLPLAPITERLLAD